MTGKRKDYISCDEYFMGVAVLSGMQFKRSEYAGGCLHCQRRSQDTLDGV